MLGKFGGPLGAIAGGILGGVIGGLFKKTKSASASIAMEAGKLDVAGIVGNSAAFKDTANTLAGAVISGINSAANALGAELQGAIKLSIGQRDKKFVVDTLGQGRTKGSGTFSFASEAEAVTFAIDKALREGVLGGIRKGTETLLKGFGDLEGRLQKAVDFENVFKALEASTDPLGALIENLDKRFQALIETFVEAGATTEEFASLEKLYQMEREKAIIEGNAKALEAVQSARDLLIDAYDRESQAILTTLERFQSLTADLESFRLSLAEQLMTAEEIYRSAKKSFDEISMLAIEGNEQAIAQLVSVSQKYLDSAEKFLTPEEYNREIQNVMKAVDLAIAQTKSMEQYAQEQLDTLKQSVDGLITLNDSVLSVKDAIKALADAQAAVKTAAPTVLVFAAPAAGTMGDYVIDENGYYRATGSDAAFDFGTLPSFASGGAFSGGLRLVGENGPELEATGASRIYNASQTADMLSGGSNVANQISGMREEMKASLYAVAKNTAQTANRLNRWDGDGLPDTRNYAI
jgi:hypothetical protein